MDGFTTGKPQCMFVYTIVNAWAGTAFTNGNAPTDRPERGTRNRPTARVSGARRRGKAGRPAEGGKRRWRAKARGRPAPRRKAAEP